MSGNQQEKNAEDLEMGNLELYPIPPPMGSPRRGDVFNQAMKIPSEFRSFKLASFASEDVDSDKSLPPQQQQQQQQQVLPPTRSSWCHIRMLCCCSPRTLLLLFAVVSGLILAVIAILVHFNLITDNNNNWQWIAFSSGIILAYPFAHMLVRVVKYALWRATMAWTLIAYYYLTVCAASIEALLTSAVLVAMWYLLILNYHHASTEPAAAYFYITQLMWWVFTTSALFCLCALGKAFSALYFERTTYWHRVNECAKREYMILKLCPKAPVPNSAVLHLHQVGEEATKADPLVLRRLTKYIKRKHLIATCEAEFGEIESSTIDLYTTEDFQDLAQVVFNHFYAGYENVLGEMISSEHSNTRARLASLKALRQGPVTTPGRSIFSPLTGGSAVNIKPKPSLQSNDREDSAPPQPPMLKTIGKTSSKLSFKLPKRHPVMTRLIVRNTLLTLTHFEKRYAMLFPEDTKEEAMVCWYALFDPMKRGSVSLKSMRTLFASFHTERIGLGDTLKDSQAAIDRLGTVCDFVALVCSLVALALLLSGGASYNVWIGLTSFLVTMAVVFGSSATQIIENLVFMFFRHPYDVGDLLVYEGSYYSVRKIELLSTTLIRWNGEYSQIPNDKMASIAICNLTRSGLHWELVEAFVDVATCTEKFVQDLTDYMTTVAVEHPESFSGTVQIICKAFGRPLVLKVQAYVEFSYRPENLTRLFADIGRVHQAFADAMRKSGATESGVGVGAIRADGHTKPVPFLVPATGLVLTSQAMAMAVGL